ncbi:hypothetical protein L9F63_022570, partial [Diploptera punctata]
MRLLLIIFIFGIQKAATQNVMNYTNIPSDFMIGTATSAYQNEGAWNVSGKGMSIWDTFVHSHPEMIDDSSTGDIAADSYNKFQEDVRIIKELHVDFYRFSISWSRILPNGELNTLNKAGIDYYNNLITELTNNNITCVVVMYHWDLPQKLQDLGGWANPIMVDFFEDYARILYENFGDKVRWMIFMNSTYCCMLCCMYYRQNTRVKWWITINEPSNIINGYNVSSKTAPGIDSPQVGAYLAAYTLLLAHARAFHLYKHEFFSRQQGRVGIVFDGEWFEPADKASRADQDAAEFAMQYQFGMFANPIFSYEGDYPQVVKDTIEKLSLAQGYPRSRVRTLSGEEVAMIRGSSDFMGINYYTSRLVKPGIWTDINTVPDKNVTLLADPNWPKTGSPYFQVVPTGIRSILNWIKRRYNNPFVLITENGYADRGELEDTERIKYIVSHMNEIMKAKNQDYCNVIGYTVWSLTDGFEWDRGY